jgi:ATP-dependent RNA helicase MSS116
MQIASIALSRDHHFISTLKEEDVNAHEHVVQEILITPGQDLLPAAFEVLRREEELATEREGFKGGPPAPQT